MSHSDRRTYEKVLGKMTTYITDNGKEIPITHEDGTSGGSLERYAVWSYDVARRKHQVTEVSNDLDKLQGRHPSAKLMPSPTRE